MIYDIDQFILEICTFCILTREIHFFNIWAEISIFLLHIIGIMIFDITARRSGDLYMHVLTNVPPIHKQAADFIGKEAVKKIKSHPSPNKIVFLHVDTTDVDPEGNETVWLGDQVRILY